MVSKLQAAQKDIIDAENVKISDMTAIGKNGNVEQFTVEVKFK